MLSLLADRSATNKRHCLLSTLNTIRNPNTSSFLSFHFTFPLAIPNISCLAVAVASAFSASTPRQYSPCGTRALRLLLLTAAPAPQQQQHGYIFTHRGFGCFFGCIAFGFDFPSLHRSLSLIVLKSFFRSQFSIFQCAPRQPHRPPPPTSEFPVYSYLKSKGLQG